MHEKRLIVTERARRDLDGIYDYIAKAGNPEVAWNFIARLSTHIERIALIGHSGVPRDVIRPGLRLVIHGRYNIYFRTTDTETVILRVLHSARDIRRLRLHED